MEIKEILQDLGYQLSNVGEYYRCKPLYRSSDSNNALSISKKTGQFTDFARGLRGSFQELIKLTLQYDSIDDAKKWLENKQFQSAPILQKPILKMDKTWSQEDIRYLFPDCSYWEKRGISKETLKVFGGGLSHSGQMLRRYVFPIFSEQGEIHGLAGRAVTENPMKWKHLGNTRIRCYPYYFNRLDIEKANEIILTESIGNMLALYACGYKHVLVMFTISLSDALLSKLIQLNPRRIILNTDNDTKPEAIAAASKVYSKLLKFFDANRIDKGSVIGYNDLSEMLEKSGPLAVHEWYQGLTI